MQTEEEKAALALTIAGYMYKQGGSRKSWKKRYFQLSEGCINYYPTATKSKLKGTLHLTEAWGVRGKRDCTCHWPSGMLPSKCFGLALNYRTYYFYSKDEGLEDWAETLQRVIDVIGEPNEDASCDHDGKPEGKKSKVARSAASLGAKATKVAVQYAGVDDTVKDIVSAGADFISDQADADFDAGLADRLQIAAGTASGILKVAEDEEEEESARKAVKKKGAKPPKKGKAKPAGKAAGKATKAAGKATKAAGKAGKGAEKAAKGAEKAAKGAEKAAKAAKSAKKAAKVAKVGLKFVKK